MASTPTNSGPELTSKSEIVELPTWWENQNIPTQLIRELRRRNASNNIGFNFPTPNNPSALVYNFEENHKKYRGPMTPWARVFSNGTGISPNTNIPQSKILLKNGKPVVYDGFIMMPGQGFYDAFGYKQEGNVLKQDKAIIGYQANGQPHYIDTEYRSQYAYKWPSEQGQLTEVPSVLPPPSLDSVSIEITKGLMATGKIDFTCYSLAQLEYLSPFFLTPRINIFIEIGWNLFNIKSLIELHDKQKCWEIIQSPSAVVDRWLSSYGNYGCITGIVKGYDYTTENGQIFKCKCEILSRQAFYEGVPVENNVSVTKSETVTKDKQKIATDTNEFTGLKTTILTDFKKLPKIIKERQNFYTGIGRTPANEFYGGKPENRIFIGRDPDIYKAPPTATKSAKISYGTSKPTKSSPTFDVVSYTDKNDFDYNVSSMKVWVQMDFLFEVINNSCSNLKDKTFFIDPDTIVSGHANLVSCNPEVLIPNAVAPKFNVGKIEDGYLPKITPADPNLNPFRESKYDKNITDTNDELFIPATRVKTVFKTKGAYRDDLDVIINKLYYDIGANKSLDAAFPFKVDTKHKVDGKDIVPTPGQQRKTAYEKVYKKYRYGNFKYIYISVDKLSEIANNKDVKTLQQFVNAVLSTLNDSVGGFWKFEITTSDAGGLKIIDNNLTLLGDTTDILQKIYVFDLGGSNSCIKSVNINTSLTKEQGVLTIYQTGANKPDKSKADMAQPGGANIPECSYSDRLDEFDLDQNNNGNNNEPPSQTPLTKDKNDLITQIQTYGDNKNVLNLTCAYLKTGQTDPSAADKNYKQLNLPPDLKSKMEQILDDGDINNLPVYSGISPNFTITVTFDGIFGMRMFQCFAISNLPKPYVPENAIFQITQVSHTINAGSGNWETVVTALVKCVSGQKIETVHV